MKRPSSKLGPGKLLRMSRRTMAALKSRRPTAKFAERLKPKHDVLKKAQLAANDAEDLVIDARAEVAMTKFDTCEFVTELELALFGEVKKDRKDPRYTAVFPVKMTKIKAKKPLDFHAWFAKAVSYLKGLPAESAGKKFAKRGEEMLAEWKSPLAALEAAELRHATALTALATAKDGWIDAYVSLHGALEEAFPRRKAFVEAFFPDDTKKAPAEEETPVPA